MMKRYLVLILLFLAISLVFAFILTFAMNGSFYFSLLISDMPSSDRLGILGQVFISIFDNVKQGLNGLLVIILALLQGVAITLMIYAKKYSQAKTVCRIGKDSGLQGVALLVSFIGVGCPTCGTSLIAPILAVFVSGISSVYMNLIGNLILVISCLLCIFAILNLIYQMKGFKTNG